MPRIPDVCRQAHMRVNYPCAHRTAQLTKGPCYALVAQPELIEAVDTTGSILYTRLLSATVVSCSIRMLVAFSQAWCWGVQLSDFSGGFLPAIATEKEQGIAIHYAGMEVAWRWYLIQSSEALERADPSHAERALISNPH
eukprot:411450-Amphidinium_carterae.1